MVKETDYSFAACMRQKNLVTQAESNLGEVCIQILYYHTAGNSFTSKVEGPVYRKLTELKIHHLSLPI